MQEIAGKFIQQFTEGFFMIVIPLTAEMAVFAFNSGGAVFTFLNWLLVHKLRFKNLGTFKAIEDYVWEKRYWFSLEKIMAFSLKILLNHMIMITL